MDSEAIANGWGPKAFCPADEHYIPTLLASRGLDNETDCTVSEQAWASGCFWRDGLINSLPCMAILMHALLHCGAPAVKDCTDCGCSHVGGRKLRAQLHF